MGDYAMAARYAFLLTIGPPLHEDGPCGRTPCQPIVYANCSRCERRYEWCTVQLSTVPAICDRSWICSPCVGTLTPRTVVTLSVDSLGRQWYRVACWGCEAGAIESTDRAALDRPRLCMACSAPGVAA